LEQYRVIVSESSKFGRRFNAESKKSGGKIEPAQGRMSSSVAALVMSDVEPSAYNAIALKKYVFMS
jgi:hypothetical protein